MIFAERQSWKRMAMNLPNIITLSRAFLLVIIFYLIYQDWPGAAFLACLLSIIAAVSDWLDGYVARKYGQVSNFGKLLDALIDKVMVLGLLLVFLDDDLAILPSWAWILVLIIVLREVLITIVRMIAVRKGVVLAAEKEGKRKTIWQSTAVCVLLVAPVVRVDLTFLSGGHFPVYLHLLEDLVYLWGMGFFLYAFALTLYSGLAYAPKYWAVLNGAAGK